MLVKVVVRDLGNFVCLLLFMAQQQIFGEMDSFIH